MESKGPHFSSVHLRRISGVLATILSCEHEWVVRPPSNGRGGTSWRRPPPGRSSFSRTETASGPADRAGSHFNASERQLDRDCTPFAATPVAPRPPLWYHRYIFWFAPNGIKPEFHEEWLRDEPCDATTTGRSNFGSRCQLSPGNGGHEIRKMLRVFRP
jgi:hypothetical protein